MIDWFKKFSFIKVKKKCALNSDCDIEKDKKEDSICTKCDICNGDMNNCTLYNKRKEDDNIEQLLDSIQVKPDEIKREKSLVPEIQLDNIDWSKKMLLIVDDNELVNNFLLEDLKIFQNLVIKKRDGINFNKLELELIELIEENNLTRALEEFNIEDYEIISVYTEYAAFAIRQNISKMKRVDYAILDIVLGGALNDSKSGKRECLNGIDVAGILNKEFHGDTELLIYTGNDLGKYSQEVESFREQLPNKASLFEYLMGKDTPLIYKRVILLNFLQKRPLKSLSFVEN